MKRITQILDDIRTQIINSQLIDDFCQLYYNKPIKVFLGADVNDLPETSNCPFALLGWKVGTVNEQNEQRLIDYEIFIFLCISQSNIQNDDKGKKYNGEFEIDHLGQLIRQEISKSVEAPIFFKEISTISVDENLTLRKYPTFLNLLTAEIKIREDRRT